MKVRYRLRIFVKNMGWVMLPITKGGQNFLGWRWMRELSDQHRWFGHRRLHILWRRKGFRVNHKKTHRIYVEESLQVRKRKKRRRSAVFRRSLLLLAGSGQRWRMDFITDQLSSGRKIRLFNVIDEFTRQCLMITNL